MTIRKFVVQLSFVFALIIGFSACEKDPITDPINAVENQTTEDENTQGTNDAQTKSQIDCEEFLAMYTEAELEELGIDPETFCDEMEWGGNEDEWDDIDWAMDCDSLVAMYADELDAFGFDLETFCEDIFDGVVVIEIDFEDVTAENCDSLILIYADQLEEWGIDPATFCDGWNGEWDGNDDWDEWGNIDWSMDCDSLVITYADQLIEWGLDPATFCDEWSGDWNGDWDYEDAVCCVVQTACGVLVYGEQIEVVAENGQITVYNADGDVLDSIECEDIAFELECH